MTSDNLTRGEAATRSALITVASYQVDLDLTRRAMPRSTGSA